MKHIARSFALLALVTASVQAAPILNQSSNGTATPNDQSGYSYVTPYGNYGSKFVANKTSIDGAGVYFSDIAHGGYWSVDPNALFTISLVDDNAKLLASGSFTQAKGGWNDVFFKDVLTTIGSSYYVFASASGYAAVTTYKYQSSTAANPGAYFFDGRQISLNNRSYTIDARIFSNDAAVPEPGSIFLLALGAIGLAAASKRRNKHAQR